MKLDKSHKNPGTFATFFHMEYSDEKSTLGKYVNKHLKNATIYTPSKKDKRKTYRQTNKQTKSNWLL